jgi:hypothetical protein
MRYRNTEHFWPIKWAAAQCMKEAYFRKEEVVPGDPRDGTVLLKPEFTNRLLPWKVPEECVKEKTLRELRRSRIFRTYTVALPLLTLNKRVFRKRVAEKKKRPVYVLTCLFKG